MNREPQNRPKPDLQAVHAELRRLYATQYPEDAPPPSPLFRRLLRRFPELIRDLLDNRIDAIVREEIGDPLDPDAALSDADRDRCSAFLDPLVKKVHFQVGRDSALSNEHHSIAHFDTLPPIIAHELITAAANDDPRSLERMGCVFFDVDGTKTIVDCTSHARAGKYLECLAEFLCKPPPAIRQWLEKRGLRSEAYAYAGDEFIVMVHSDDRPVDKRILDAFAAAVQKALAADAMLTSFVSFDDPEFIVEYDDWSDEDREAYKKNPSSMRERLTDSRATLPERFIPSVSFGSATFLRALQEALSPDTEESDTLEELGVNAFRLMVARADARLKKDKRIFRENMEDPLWKAFLLRNGENRRLLAKIENLRAQLKAVLEKKEQQE